MKISRVGGLSQPNRTLEQCKAEIDNALLTGEWVIFEDHAGYGFYQDPANLDLLRELIQYIKSKGVPIVNIRDGAMMKANIKIGRAECREKEAMQKNERKVD